MSTDTRVDHAATLDALLAPRIAPAARDWLADACAECASGVTGVRFASLVSLASRHVKDGPLAPEPALLERAARELPGWTPSRWTIREAARVRLVLARTDLESDVFAADLEEAFRYADEGELRALYKSLGLLPANERFAWRAAEGCRTNIVPVFEAIACDNPYPAARFDALAFRQLAIKALFIGAPLWRVHGLDDRLDEELARMALDLVEERTSAGRPIPPELWACLGTHGGARGLAALERELEREDEAALRGACLALARAGRARGSRELAADAARSVRAEAARAALAGPTDSTAFRHARPESA